ncbi:hypothetical protein [Chryseobacterium mulctrae]|uniref:hypothetical protein n=1 Tax=Chryseobacterium mulctrae TaxID=2576777 RepID=UPI001116F2EF|nr:hypothetical protein [Chryseobacterium mulctrae]
MLQTDMYHHILEVIKILRNILVALQIVAPTGNKTLLFKARRNSQNSYSSCSSRIGIKSYRHDNHRCGRHQLHFLQILIRLSQERFQVHLLLILFFKTVNEIALTQHTAADFDDVVYDLTANLAVSDNEKNNSNIQFAVNSENTALEFVAKGEIKNTDAYLASGQKVASGKANNNRFEINTLQPRFIMF